LHRLRTSRLFAEPARPARIRDWPGAPWLAVAAVCIGAFMGQLDASIVTLAVPSLRDELHASLGAVVWVSLAYLLVLVGAVSAVGRWADMIGRKLLYTYGFGVFTLASLGCALSPNLPVLILMRSIQALGAAMLQANSVALIRTTVRRDQLNRAIGIQGTAQALGLAVGPAVGGALMAFGGWRWVFYVNLPAGALGMVLGWLLLPRTRVRAERTGFDWTGLCLLLPATAALLLALSMLDHGSVTVAVITALLVAAVLFAAFVTHARRAAAPLIEPVLFRLARFRSGISSGLLAYLVTFGVLLAAPLYLEAAFGESPARAGLMITVLPAFLALGAPLGALAADRFGAAPVTTAGMVLCATACAVAGPTVGERGLLVAMLALAGFGLGLFTPANNATIAGAGRPDQAGMVSGILNMTRGIGTALGVAVAGATYSIGASTVGTVGEAPGPAADGFRLSMLVLAALAALAAADQAVPLTPSHRKRANRTRSPSKSTPSASSR
jgi:EmrB/QacA subfamily drug resistance transporter